MKAIIVINIFLAAFCFQTKAQGIPDLSIHNESFNHLTAINLNKQILLPPVDNSFLIFHLVCQPGSCKILPLQLIEFKGKTIGAINYLTWKTVNEIQTKLFEIQRSADAISFKPIGNVNALNSSGTNKYEFDDESPANGKNYYRLRMIDVDGNFTYSNIILLENDATTGISIYPNPAHQTIKIKLQSLGEYKYEISINNSAGKKIVIEKRTTVIGLNNWELNVNQIGSGFYILSIRKINDGEVTNIPVEIMH